MSMQISDISAVLKKVIVPKIQLQIPQLSILADKVKRNVGVTIANNQIYIAARTQRHSGIYSVAEGTVPNSGQATYQQPYTSMAYMFGTMAITDQAIEAASSGEVKAVAAILATEINALKEDFALDLNRILHGDGSGILCKTNGAQGGGGSTTLTVQLNPNGQDPTEYLSPNMYISIGGAAAVQITAVTGTTTVTLASAQTWSDQAVVTKAAAAEAMGLIGLIDDGSRAASIQNITRATNPWSQSFVNDTTTALSESDMSKIFLKTRRFGGSKACLMGVNMFNKYGAILISYKKSADMKEVLDGGWSGLEFMGGMCPVILDFDTWDGFAQFVDFDALTMAEMSKPMQWLEGDAHGGILIRNPNNRTQWEGTLKYYFQFVALKFKSHGRLSNKS